MSLVNDNEGMRSYEIEGVEDVTTRIERDGNILNSGLSVLDAYDKVSEPLYKLVDSRANKEYEPVDSYGLGGRRMAKPEMDSKEEKWLGKWSENRDELDIITSLEPVNGREEEFHWEMRQKNPEDVNQPFSMVTLKSENGGVLGLRIARDYNPEILERSSITDNSDIDLDHTSRLRYSSNMPDKDEWGWLQEPYLCAALDSEEGVHDYLDNNFDDLPELTPDYWLVDWNQSPVYQNSNEEMAFVYEWGEPMFNNGLSRQGAERLGEHAASLHSLGLMTFIDRDPEELIDDPGPEGFRAQQRDLEFALHTTNDQRVNGRDFPDLIQQVENGIKDYHKDNDRPGAGSVEERNQIRDRTRQIKDRRKQIMNEIEEDLTHLVPENTPMNIDPDVFSSEITNGLEWE